MSEVSTLLPASSVGVFVKNKKLKKDIGDLVEDWRYPRVHIDMIDGNVDTAISTYRTQSAHDLIVIETEVIDESFTDQLKELSGYCLENTAAIVIGPQNDINLYRHLMDMGVSDYVVHPIEKKELSDIVAKALIDRLGMAESSLITVIGAKGGVGTSSIAQALALGFSEKWNQKTLLMDAAGGSSYNTVALGQEPITTLKEAGKAALSEDAESMSRMISSISDKLSILASGGEPCLEDPILLEDFDNITNNLMSTYPFVVFDASASTVSVQRSAVSRSHKIYVITTPTLSSLRSARALIQEITGLRGGDKVDQSLIHLVVNMKGALSGQEVAKNEAEEAIETKIDTIIDFSTDLFPQAEMDGKRINELKGSEKVIDDLLEGVKTLVKRQDNDGSSEESPLSIIEYLLSKLKG